MHHVRLVTGIICLTTLSNTLLAQTKVVEETILAQSAQTEEVKSRIKASVDERDGKNYTVIVENDSVYEARLQAIENVMPMTYNDNVQTFIDFFMIRRPSFTKSMLEKKEFYFPIFEKYLAQYNMPDELKYLSLLESGLNPKAVSRAKAVGLWQFMTVTGREQGLLINEHIDERMHIEKSTDAACRYLRTLYKMFGDWDLALAAYNSGPGTIRRAMKQSGKTDYWEIHNYIPKDTRVYVPQFIAIAYMMNYADLHGIYPEKLLCPVPTEPLYIDGYFDLTVFSELSGVEKDELAFLNPHIKTTKLPASTCDFVIQVPKEKIDRILENSVAIFDSAGKAPFVPEVLLAKEEESDIPAETETIVKTITVRHKVRRGEFLNKIAARYNVSVNEIKQWNRMKSSKVMVGQTLTIKQQKTIVKSVTPQLAVKKPMKETVDRTPSYHTVQPGDTLWNISQRYNGLSIDQLKRLNNLNGNTLKVGQKLKIASS